MPLVLFITHSNTDLSCQWSFDILFNDILPAPFIFFTWMTTLSIFVIGVGSDEVNSVEKIWRS